MSNSVEKRLNCREQVSNKPVGIVAPQQRTGSGAETSSNVAAAQHVRLSEQVQNATSAQLEKRRLIQQQLVLAIHALHCQNQACTLPHCRTMKNVLNHLSTCNAGRNCTVAYCSSSRLILGHWRHCRTTDCPVCSPVQQAARPGQDDDNIELWNSICQRLSDTRATAVQVGTKEWHRTISCDLRKHLVQKIVRGIFPNPDASALLDRRMHNLIGYAKKVEDDFYQMANSRAEYYRLIAEKIYQAQKYLEEKRQQRRQQQAASRQRQVRAASGTLNPAASSSAKKMKPLLKTCRIISKPINAVRPTLRNRLTSRRAATTRQVVVAATRSSTLTSLSQLVSAQRCVLSLVHACQCREANCRFASCQRMKRVVQHIKTCKRRTSGGCPICKQLVALCCHHARHCQEAKCPVPFCFNIKQKLRQPAALATSIITQAIKT